MNIENELNNCKLVISKIINNSNLKVSCDEITAHIREEIDTDKFSSWLNYNLDKFKSKTNQASYFKKAFVNELERGPFTLVKVQHLPNTQPLINELRSKGIVLLADDTAYLYVMWGQLLNLTKIPLDLAIRVNRQAINSLGISDNFETYKKLVKNSTLLKGYRIDWENIELKTIVFISNWNKTLDALGDSYD